MAKMAKEKIGSVKQKQNVSRNFTKHLYKQGPIRYTECAVFCKEIEKLADI